MNSCLCTLSGPIGHETWCPHGNLIQARPAPMTQPTDRSPSDMERARRFILGSFGRALEIDGDWSMAAEERDAARAERDALRAELQKGNVAYEALLHERDQLKAALERISNFYVTRDPGRFGEFIGAGAVDIAREALAAGEGGQNE